MRRSRMIGLAIGLLIALGIGAGVAAVSADEPSAGPENENEFRVAGDGQLPSSPPHLEAARAPLTADEIGYATYLIASHQAAARSVAGDAGPQVLSVDLPSPGEARGAERLAVVVAYDYARDRLAQHVVSLSERRIVSSASKAGVQPPSVPDEADAALQLALSSDADLSFREQFLQTQGVPLLTADQVRYVAGTWTYDQSTVAGKQCGAHRCVRLLVQSPAGDYFETGDFVVDLSARTIVKLR
ncbi:hypothetical protein ACLM5J_17320 [Nocardioides sp. Bht2]|uniref:hypothetical protein n=1 Tax=Nocardioides sp. Bht2 TaxID=3392297 RepID=UPI0039B37BE8